MLQPFSNAYMLTELYVTRDSGETATVNMQALVEMNSDLFEHDDVEVADLEAPIIAKLGSGHIPVYGEEGVEASTLRIPQPLASTLLPNARIPATHTVKVALPTRAQQLVGITDTLPREDPDVESALY